MEHKSFDGFEVTSPKTDLKGKVKKVVRQKIKRCPLCNTKHYEPTNVCKLCKEKY